MSVTNFSVFELLVSLMNQGVWQITQDENWQLLISWLIIIPANAGDSWEILSREDQRKPIGWRHNHDLIYTYKQICISNLYIIFQEAVGRTTPVARYLSAPCISRQPGICLSPPPMLSNEWSLPTKRFVLLRLKYMKH